VGVGLENQDHRRLFYFEFQLVAYVKSQWHRIVADALLHRTMQGDNSPQPAAGISIAPPIPAALHCVGAVRRRQDRRHATRAASAAAAMESHPLKNILAIVLAGAVGFVAVPSLAADAATPNPQQERMKTCNAKATDKKGDERKKFMSECLSAEKKADDNKMAECNAKSKGMKADERNKFMSECLKKKAA
jgi:hypothetical protein